MSAKTRLLATAPAVLLLLSLAACGSSESKESAPENDTQVSQGTGDAAEKEKGEKKEPPLTGDAKVKAEKAALAAYPGTVLKSEHDVENPGLYAVEIKQKNGVTIEVYLDPDSYKVVKTKKEEPGEDADD